jgi:hypothetical protein
MKAISALAVAGMVFVPAITTPAFTAPQKINRVSVSYVPPKNPAHQVIYELLKERRWLEKLQEFLSPFRLPRTLKVELAGCNGDANASSLRRPVWSLPACFSSSHRCMRNRSAMARQDDRRKQVRSRP